MTDQSAALQSPSYTRPPQTQRSSEPTLRQRKRSSTGGQCDPDNVTELFELPAFGRLWDVSNLLSDEHRASLVSAKPVPLCRTTSRRGRVHGNSSVSSRRSTDSQRQHSSPSHLYPSLSVVLRMTVEIEADVWAESAINRSARTAQLVDEYNAKRAERQLQSAALHPRQSEPPQSQQRQQQQQQQQQQYEYTKLTGRPPAGTHQHPSRNIRPPRQQCDTRGWRNQEHIPKEVFTITFEGSDCSSLCTLSYVAEDDIMELSMNRFKTNPQLTQQTVHPRYPTNGQNVWRDNGQALQQLDRVTTNMQEKQRSNDDLRLTSLPDSTLRRCSSAMDMLPTAGKNGFQSDNAYGDDGNGDNLEAVQPTRLQYRHSSYHQGTMNTEQIPSRARNGAITSRIVDDAVSPFPDAVPDERLVDQNNVRSAGDRCADVDGEIQRRDGRVYRGSSANANDANDDVRRSDASEGSEKELPETINVEGGKAMMLRTSRETIEAVAAEKHRFYKCWGCSSELVSVEDCRAVYCILCHTISPVIVTTAPTGGDDSSSPVLGGTIGLGLTMKTIVGAGMPQS